VPFRTGERLSYDISWSSFITATAATATVAVREKRPAYGSVAYYIVAEGQPTPFLAAFYSLYYKADTWLDAYTLLPLRASIFSQERARRESEVTLFDQARRRARFEAQGDRQEGAGGNADGHASRVAHHAAHAGGRKAGGITARDDPVDLRRCAAAAAEDAGGDGGGDVQSDAEGGTRGGFDFASTMTALGG
jgi:hypothetical protein